MTLVGLSPALGTFLAGVVLANSEYRHELESDIDPFKGLLLGLFFMTVGAGINFALLFDNLLPILLMTVGLMAVKALVLLALAVAFRIEGADRWLFALGLAQAGEFGFVLLSFTVANEVIPQSVADQLLLVVALSMLLTPALFIAYDRLIAPRFGGEVRDADDIEEDNHIIVAGHGRVGGIVNRMLRAAGYETTVIDYSSKQLEMLAKFGFKAYYGDATRPDLLESAGLGEAKLLVIAIDNKEQTTEMVRYCLSKRPDLKIVARAVDRNHVYDLWFAGCREIIRESYDSSLRMGRVAFECLGLSHAQAERLKDIFHEQDRAFMLEAATHYDPEVPPPENEAYTAAVRGMAETWETDVRTRMRAVIDGEGEASA